MSEHSPSAEAVRELAEQIRQEIPVRRKTLKDEILYQAAMRELAQDALWKTDNAIADIRDILDGVSAVALMRETGYSEERCRAALDSLWSAYADKDFVKRNKWRR